MPDAVVVGAGPNGLVAANVLADAGWEVVVLEAEPVPGGAVRSGDHLGPGLLADVCSSFYPLAAASPALSGLGLEEHGLRWRHAPAVLANPLPDAPAALLFRDPERTAEGLGSAGGAEGWRRLTRRFDRAAPGLLRAIFGPFPPLRALGRLAGDLGLGPALRLARLAVLPARRLAAEEGLGAPGALLLAGSALHTDLGPDIAGSGFFGWLLAMIGQRYGFPVPEGGAQALADALVRRLKARGGVLRCGEAVRSVEVAGGTATGVVTERGQRVGARRAVLAAVSPTALYGSLVGWEALPAFLAADLSRFQWDFATVKVDWALERPLPWLDPAVAEAGTVHVADSLDELSRFDHQLRLGVVPDRPYLVVGQPARADPTRSPGGTEVVWAYTHVPLHPRGDAGGTGGTGKAAIAAWGRHELAAFAERIEARLERCAPGFTAAVRARQVLGPSFFEQHDANLVGGALNGGTSAVHQQLFFRPVPGLGRPETPVERLYLASSSAHPGGGVHGACGANAARAALAHDRLAHRVLLAPLLRAARRAAERVEPAEPAGRAEPAGGPEE